MHAIFTSKKLIFIIKNWKKTSFYLLFRNWSVWYLLLSKSSMLRPLSCERNVFDYRESFILDSSTIIHSNILIRCWDSCTFGALWWIKLRLTNFECAIINFCYDDIIRFLYWLDALCSTPKHYSNFNPGDGKIMVRSARFQTCIYSGI